MSAHSDVRAAALLRERPLFGAVPFPSLDCSLIALNSSITCSTQYIHGNGKGKGKSVPLQARRGPEDSRKLRFPDIGTGWR